MYGQQHTPAPGSLKALMGGMGGMEAAPQPAGYGMGSYAYSQGMWKLRRRAADVAIDWTEVEAVAAVGRKGRVRVLSGASGAGLVRPWGSTGLVNVWFEVEPVATGWAAVDVGGDSFCCTLLGKCCGQGQQRFPLQQRLFITVSQRWLHQNNECSICHGFSALIAFDFAEVVVPRDAGSACPEPTTNNQQCVLTKTIMCTSIGLSQ